MNVATNLSQLEKIYANSYNHDVKAPIIYVDDKAHLFADPEFTKPVSKDLIRDLFCAGVVVCNDEGVGGKHYTRALTCDDLGILCIVLGSNEVFYFYDVEADGWTGGYDD